MSSRLLSSRLIFRKFSEIENFESRQRPNYGLYRRKLIGYGVSRSIARVHIDQTRPLDTLWICVRPRVRVSEAEIQYLASVGRRPSVHTEAHTERFQTENFLKFPESFRTNPGAFECIRTHPNASEQVRTGPSKSENLEKLAKTSKKSQKLREKIREGLFVVFLIEFTCELSSVNSSNNA